MDGYYEGEHHFTKIERLSNPDRADEVRAAHQRMSPHLEDGAGETVRLAMSGNYWPHALADQGVILFREFAAWRTPWMSTDAVVAVRTHELGHHQVVRYRLVPAAEVDR